MSLEPKRPVTIEDLLSLKRTERPPAEFWEQFDRALRAKQLAALVEKRPWWRTLPETFSSWRRYARYTLPLGATAILAVTFVTLRERPAAPAAESSGVPVASATPIDLRARNVGETFAPRESSNGHSVVLPKTATHASVQHGSLVARAEPATDVVAPASSVEGAAGVEGGLSPLPPSARHIATNLMVAQITDPTLSRGILATPAAMEVGTSGGRVAVEPLTQIASAGSSRYARLRTAMASPVVNTVAREADHRVARDLSDDRLIEDAIRRFAAKGDRFSVKF